MAPWAAGATARLSTSAAHAAKPQHAPQPLTCGAAMDVPLIVDSAVSELMPALVMYVPGAKIARHAPMLLKDARPSCWVLAPTVMALGADPGLLLQASARLLLPAATTTVMPADARSSTASLREAERGPPRDKDTTADAMLLVSLWFLALQRDINSSVCLFMFSGSGMT